MGIYLDLIGTVLQTRSSVTIEFKELTLPVRLYIVCTIAIHVLTVAQSTLLRSRTMLRMCTLSETPFSLALDFAVGIALIFFCQYLCSRFTYGHNILNVKMASYLESFDMIVSEQYLVKLEFKELTP